MKNNKKDCDLNLFSTSFFSPIEVYWQQLFVRNSTLNIEKFINSYSIHLYGSATQFHIELALCETWSYFEHLYNNDFTCL